MVVYAMTPAFSFVAALLLSWLMIVVGRRSQVVALPDHRSSHVRPTPTMGGVAIAVPVFGWALWHVEVHEIARIVLLAGLPVTLIGLVDDIRNLSARARLPVHVLAALLAVLLLPHVPVRLLGFLLEPSWLVLTGYALGLVWFINLYNFMDGIDGIAAVQCIGYGAFLAIVASPADPAVQLTLVLTAAVVGFLTFNWAPARLFMGDVGSGLLGTVLGLIVLDLALRGIVPLVASLIVFTPFWFDATYTLCARILTQQRFTAPHRSHAYQKIARRLGHGWTTAIYASVITLWLGPLAWYTAKNPQALSVAALIGAMLPFAGLCVVLRAGTAERTES
jgi:Fuc2NAc and GlcNAc transferase